MGNNETTPSGPNSLLGEGELKSDKQVVNQISVVPLLQWVFVLHIMGLGWVCFYITGILFFKCKEFCVF